MLDISLSNVCTLFMFFVHVRYLTRLQMFCEGHKHVIPTT
jgi:hypothetical protein